MLIDQLTRPTINSTAQIFTESRHNKLLREDTTYRKFHNLSRMLAERNMSEKEILDLFSAVEAGANASGQNRTALGKGKDVVAGAYSSAKDAISGVLNSIQMSTPVAGVDAAYNDATGALRDTLGGDSRIMDSIKKYRLLAKEYPKTQLFVKTALIALAGLATGGAGLPAIAGLTAAVDAAIKGEKLSSIIGKGAGAAIMGLGAQKLQAALAGGSVPVDQSLSPGEELVTPGDQATGAAAETSRFDDIVSNAVDYKVKSGDTLSDILADRKINPEAFKRLPGNEVFFSPDGNPNILKAGQTIKLPDPADAPDLNRLSYTSPDTANWKTFDKEYDTTGYSGQYNPNNSVASLDAANNLRRQGLGQLGSDSGMAAARVASDAAKSVRESWLPAVALRSLPASELINRWRTASSWSLLESTNYRGQSVHLTHRGVLTVFENVDRYRKAIAEARIPSTPAGPGRNQLPSLNRPDMPGAPVPQTAQPGVVGQGLNWLDRATGKVGGYLSKQAQNFTRKVTAAKLKTEWEQLGHFTDSDQIAAFLAKQGVPQPVINDVYGTMGIPLTAPVTQPAATTAQTGTATKKSEYTNNPYAVMSAPTEPPAVEPVEEPVAQPQPATQPQPVAQAQPTGGPAGFNASNVMNLPGMEKYAKPAAPAKAPNFAGPGGYGKVTTSFKPVTPAATKVPVTPAAPKQPITIGGQKILPTDPAYDKIMGKATVESLTWSKNFDPGMTLLRKMRK